jgi:hypothetical protein
LDIKSLALSVKTSMRDEFTNFVETGDASQAFLDYLDKDPKAQRAVEEAFNAQASSLEELAREISSNASQRMDSRAVERELASAQDPTDQIVNAVERVAKMPANQQEAVVQSAGSAIRNKAGFEKLLTVLSNLQRSVQ